MTPPHWIQHLACVPNRNLLYVIVIGVLDGRMGGEIEGMCEELDRKMGGKIDGEMG